MIIYNKIIMQWYKYMTILVWYGMAWYGMVWHEALGPSGPMGPSGRASWHAIPYIPYRAIPYQYYHIRILLYFILLYIIILLYYNISDVAYCSLFFVHAPIQHLGHLKDLIVCIIPKNYFCWYLSRFLNFWCWSQPPLSYPIRNIWASN